MGFFGSILSLPINIINAPIRAAENLFDEGIDEDGRVISSPLKKLADEIKKIDD